MLDIKYIKENPDEVIERLAKKGKDAAEEIAEILRLDAERRALISSTETIKAEQNKTNKLIPQYKKEGRDVSEIFAKMKEMGAQVKADEEKLKEVADVTSRCMPFGDTEEVATTCVCCGRPAKSLVYWGKAY